VYGVIELFIIYRPGAGGAGRARVTLTFEQRCRDRTKVMSVR
jgi:hypothetical protein